MKKLSEREAALFSEGKNFGHLGLARPDGSVQVTPMWVDYDGGYVVVNTVRGRKKEQYMRDNPTATIEVLDPENPYNYVSVTGPVEEFDEDAEARIDSLAKKYLGVDVYPNRTPDMVRVSFRIAPERVNARWT
jgi:PPOX class probable F420-dependent enzyme